MPFSSTPTWLPALVALAAAMVAGALYLWLSSRRPQALASRGDDPNPEKLQRRVEQLMEQLREMEVDKHLFAPEELARQREQIEAEAARALQARDTYHPTASPPTSPGPAALPAAEGFLARNPQLKGALWGGGVVLFFVFLGLYLGQDNAPRNDGPVTGGGGGGQTAPMGSASGTPNADSELDALRAHLQDSPDDISSGARAAHLLLRQQEFEEAAEITHRDLMLDPFHTETRIHSALLRAAKGDSPVAEKELIHLADTYPRAHEALLYLGMLRLSRGDKKAALEAFERFSKEAPSHEQPPMLTNTLASLRAEVRGASTP